MNPRSDDHSLVHSVARSLSVPREGPANSFVLHASLELMARAALLPLVGAEALDAARERLRWLAATFEASSDPVAPPPDVEPDPDRLVAALTAGDLDEVDAQVDTLARVSTHHEFRRLLAVPILRSLAAAAHGSILLHLSTRDETADGLPLGLARQALREMARFPTWQLSWFDDPNEPQVTRTLAEALTEVPSLGSPGSHSIYPLMHQAEESGLARRLLGGVRADPVTAERTLARVAAWSMLQEPPDHAPYGWSHCLTMPQATVRLADLSSAAAPVAATYVVGFRAAHGSATLDPDWVPDQDSPEADAWFDPSPATVTDLASFAAAHEDAHLAKYTLACFDAAVRDPAYRHLYLAAATRLARWWKEQRAEQATTV